MTGNLSTLIQIGLDLLGQGLAQLDTPLVKAIDIPYRALSEGQVLVVRDQSAERPGRNFLCKDRSRRSVTEECLVGNKVGGCTLGLDFFNGLADHKGLGLCEEIRC